MRRYRPGDPVRSIHWKISAKFDSLIIREPLVAPPHSRLVYIERWNKMSERDLILGRLRWISNYLLKWELPFFVKLDGVETIAEVSRYSELTDYLHRVLDDSMYMTTTSSPVPAGFTWVFRVDARGAAGGDEKGVGQ